MEKSLRIYFSLNYGEILIYNSENFSLIEGEMFYSTALNFLLNFSPFLQERKSRKFFKYKPQDNYSFVRYCLKLHTVLIRLGDCVDQHDTTSSWGHVG